MDAVLGFLNRPLFGLPIWIWLLIVAGGIFVARIIIPKITGSSGTSSQGSLGSSAGGGVTSSNATPLDQSLYDPSTGIPLSVENATNPATGLPNYNNLVGLQATTGQIASTQSNPTAGAGVGTTPAAAAPQYVTVTDYTNANDLTSNDTLYNIAQNSGYGSNWQALWKLNPQITNPYLLTPGQQVRVS